MLSIWQYIVHWFQFNYVPGSGHPFYTGATWGNIFVTPLVIIFGWVWSKTKFWPLKPLEHAVKKAHEKLDSAHEKLDSLHEKHDALAAHVDDLHAKHDKVLAHQDHHDNVLKAIADHLGLEVPPSPSESQTDQTQTDQS